MEAAVLRVCADGVGDLFFGADQGYRERLMPEIKSLDEFRKQLGIILEAHKIPGCIGAIEYLALEIEVSGLALDYADGFYRDRLRLKEG